MLISHAHFPIPSSLDTSSSPRSRCFSALFFIITLNLTTITLRPVKRENQLNSHFLLHRLPFYASFFSFVLFIHHLIGLHHFLSPRCVYTWSFLSSFFRLSHNQASIRSGSLTFNHCAAFDEITKERKRRGDG